MRALEVHTLTGRPISDVASRPGTPPRSPPIPLRPRPRPHPGRGAGIAARSALRADQPSGSIRCSRPGGLTKCGGLRELPQPLSREARQALGLSRVAGSSRWGGSGLVQHGGTHPHAHPSVRQTTTDLVSASAATASRSRADGPDVAERGVKSAGLRLRAGVKLTHRPETETILEMIAPAGVGIPSIPADGCAIPP